tara:strand:+ start:4373 stop:6457 length:2085 start_codon:yes stop_codon:yes gene_type:complete
MPFETDKSGGFKIDASELLKTGVYPERFDRKIPFWETVDGVQYTEFGMRRKAGRERIKDYKESPFESNTPMRGIVAAREYGTKVAYVGDLNNIYSFTQQDSTAGGAQGFDIVGTGYVLLRNSEGTTWDSTEALTITSAAITFGTISITTDRDHGLIPGTSVTISGLTGFSSPNPNATWTVNYPTGSGTTPSNVLSIRTGTSVTETYSTSGSSLATLPETNWDNSGTTWDESTNESDQWDFETFGSFVVGAKGSTKPVIKKNNVNFNTYYNDEVSGAAILSTNTGGAGYSVDDTLTTTVSPIGGNGLTATVTEVSAGVITAFEITNFGSGYSSGDVITFSGGTTPATATITVPEIDFDSLECFHRQGPHMLAFNYSKGDIDYSTSFAWCSADDLDTWTAAATNTAGSLLIREAETPIRCVAQLGNGLAVYTETQMFIVNYVGQPNIFGYKVALENGVGAVSPNSVISVGRMNYGVSRDGFFATDGASVRMIGRESGMNQYFRDNVAMSELAQIYGFENSKENEVVWGIPKGEASITEEIYYNYKTNQWGIRTSIISAYLDRGVFHEALSADSNGNLYFEGNTPNNTNPDSQVTQPVSAVTKAHDLNNADRVKEITAIRVGKEGNGSPRMSIGWSNTIDAEPTYLNKDSFLIDDSFKSFPVRAAGRYIHIKVESSGSSDDWTLTDLVVQGRYEGER